MGTMVTDLDEAVPTMGVVVVTFNSADQIGNCLHSLLASEGVNLRIVVVDNASADSTHQVVRSIAESFARTHSYAEQEPASGGRAEADLTLLKAPQNGGYAYGVNRGIEVLMGHGDIDLFWILNPDCEVPPDTASLYCAAGADGNFALMGGRTVYLDRPGAIQSDGGRVSRWTGVCHPVNLGASASSAPLPAIEEIDFISGANCVASRQFIEMAGMMHEEYFLYYEEVDWAFRRGAMPLRLVPGVSVRHQGGTSIGSGSLDRRPSAFANYVNYRSRMIFLRRFMPLSMPIALAHALAKAMQLVVLGAFSESVAILRGILHLRPPAGVSQRLPAHIADK